MAQGVDSEDESESDDSENETVGMNGHSGASLTPALNASAGARAPRETSSGAARGDFRKLLRESGKANGGLYGVEVGGWGDEGEVETGKAQEKRKKALKQQANEERSRRRERQLDEWDRALDSGRQKKVKKKADALDGPSHNPFQRAQEARQQGKFRGGFSRR